MIRLPFPIVCIEIANPITAIETLRRSMSLAAPTGCFLLTDIRKFIPSNIHGACQSANVSLVNHIEGNQVIRFPGVSRTFFKDYETALLTEPIKHIGTSSHVLYMEWDSGILNPSAWDNGWLEYDFIGAPWPPHSDPGWPPCDGETNAVGNTGFSLQSRKFMEAVRIALSVFKDDSRRFSCDRWACRTIRPWLEKEHGIKFAPVSVAERFSCEDRVYSGSFGFHGKSTVKINNWGAWFDAIKDRMP